ncbi:MAG: hypothetical protein WCK13_02460 [Ignavibacteriota bacterium]|nr:hypothetical protein [Ignavibacteriota bacterium]
MKKFSYRTLILTVIVFSAFSCSNKPSSEKLPMSVKASFNLLPEKPQFVMYVNFKYLRTTDFWKENISDSIFSAENTFGSILNVFKSATGATISDGLDEIFFANSWTGENAIVMKGSFDRNKITNYLGNDTVFRKTDDKKGFIYYTHIPSNTMFFLKDNFTLCASNYQEQLSRMKDIPDTSSTGLINNQELMTAINAIMYKESLWLVSTEKTFIRGIFANFTDMKSGKKFDKSGSNADSLLSTQPDSLSKSDDIITNRLFEKVSSISLNAKMKNELDLVLQFECMDSDAAAYVDKLFNGIIGLAKISSAGKKDKKDEAFDKVLNDISVRRFDNAVLVSARINSENIKEFRSSNMFLKK